MVFIRDSFHFFIQTTYSFFFKKTIRNNDFSSSFRAMTTVWTKKKYSNEMDRFGLLNIGLMRHLFIFFFFLLILFYFQPVIKWKRSLRKQKSIPYEINNEICQNIKKLMIFFSSWQLWLVCLFNGISTFMGHLISKTF